MKERGLEFKVGLFVFLGLAMLAALVVQFGRVGEGMKHYYALTVNFPAGRTALLTFGAEARIEIGDRVEIDGAGLMSASTIVIDDDAILGPCLVVDTDFHAIGPGRRRAGETASRRPIRIGRGAWVQGKATILKGVSVGEGAVVRWGSLVTTDVPAGAVVMGNPAARVDGG